MENVIVSKLWVVIKRHPTYKPRRNNDLDGVIAATWIIR